MKKATGNQGAQKAAAKNRRPAEAKRARGGTAKQAADGTAKRKAPRPRKPRGGGGDAAAGLGAGTMDSDTEKKSQCADLPAEDAGTMETEAIKNNRCDNCRAGVPTLEEQVPDAPWTENAKLTFEVVHRHHDLDWIQWGLCELVRRKDDWRFGSSKSHILRLMERSMSEAHRLLWMILENGCPDDSEHDERVKIWATNALAKFYANIETGRKRGNFASAMAGRIGLSGPHSFKARFAEECRALNHESDGFQRVKVIRRFLATVLQVAGFFRTYPSYSGPRRRLPNGDEEANFFQRGELPMFVEPEDLAAWRKQQEHEVGASFSLPRLSADEFEWAWDRNGKTLRELKRMMAADEARGFGDPEKLNQEIFYELRTKETLPLKWVAAKNWGLMKDIYLRAGVKKPPAYLGKVEVALKEAAKVRLVDGMTDCDQDD